MLDRAHGALARLTRVCAILSGYALLGLALAICAEIVMRRTVNVSMQGVDELGGYVLAGISGFAFAYGLVERSHTRIDLILGRVGPRAQAVLNVGAAVVFAALALFMAARAQATFAQSWAYGSLAPTPWQTPIWIPQAVWLTGLTLFAVVAIVLAARAVAACRRGARAVNAIAGPLSLEDEIGAERHGDDAR